MAVKSIVKTRVQQYLVTTHRQLVVQNVGVAMRTMNYEKGPVMTPEYINSKVGTHIIFFQTNVILIVSSHKISEIMIFHNFLVI